MSESSAFSNRIISEVPLSSLSSSLGDKEPNVQACSPVKPLYQNRRGSRISNPIVSAMLSSNNLSDCNQIRDLLHHCKQNNSSAVICHTAELYFERCLGQTKG